MGKTKLLALSGICGSVAVVCMLLSSMAIFATFVLSVIASIAVVIPLLVDPKGLIYSLLIYAVSSVLGAFSAFAIGNAVFVAPCVAFSMPFAIVKVYGETVKVSAKLEQTEKFEDPFVQGEETHIVSVKLDGKKRLHPIVRWALYYVLLEASIGLTLLSAYLLAEPMFNQIVQNKFFYLLLAALQLAVIPYDLLMRGCLIATTKVLHKIVK